MNARRRNARRGVPGSGLVGTVLGGLVVFLWRFASGQPLNGRPRTDATFWHAGTGLLAVRMKPGEAFWSPVSGRPPSRRELRAGWDRAARRLGVTAAVIAWLWGRAAHPTATTVVTALAALAGASWGAWVARERWRRRQLAESVVKPLHVALGHALGLPAGVDPYDWLSIPADYRDNPDTQVRVTLPSTFNGSVDGRKLVHSITVGKLGGGEWDSVLHMAGTPVMIFRHAPQPPDRVLFADVIALMESLPPNEFLIGIGSRNTPETFDLDEDSPHIALSAGSGAGKSVLAETVARQVLHKGGRVVILDHKRNSHKWARGLPGVEYYRDAEEIHAAAIRLGKELDARQRIADDDDNAQFQRIFIIYEEMNYTVGKLRAVWAEARSKDDPKVSPAISAIADISFAGRNVSMNLLGIAQKLTAQTFGMPGGEPRENFAYRALARYTMNTWKMLCPEVWPAPKSSGHVGRWQIVSAGVARAVQVVFRPPDQLEAANAWTVAGAGDPAAAEPAVTVDRDPGSLGEGTVTVTDVRHLSVVADTDSERRYTLAEAAREGIPEGMPGDEKRRYASLRQAKSRDPEFPEGLLRNRRDTFTADELNSWYRNRPRAVG